MTVATTDKKSGPFTCNGSIDTYAGTYKIQDASQAHVIRTDADGAETVLTITTDYTVSAITDSGFTITTVATYPAGEFITLLRGMDFLQSTNINNQGAYLASSMEDALDKHTMEIQELQERVDRSVKIDASSSATTDQTAYLSAAQTAASQAESARDTTLSYANSTAVRARSVANVVKDTVLVVGGTVDGVTLAAGDRVLLDNQTTTTEDGVWVVSVAGVPTRAPDFAAGSVASGALVTVMEGTIENDKIYKCTNTQAAGVVGTDDLVFTEAFVNGSTIAVDTINEITPANGVTVDSLSIKDQGLANLKNVGFPTSTELTIATGVIAPTQMLHTVDTQSDDASDDLATITHTTGIDVLYLRAENAARTVNIVETGNIKAGGVTLVLDDTDRVAHLVYDGTNWQLIDSRRAADTDTIVLHVRDEKSSGVNGQSFTNNSWNTRDIQTVKTNNISGASLSANQITLPAGTYYMELSCNVHHATSTGFSANKLRLRNITDVSDTLIGTAGTTSPITQPDGQTSRIIGTFTLAATKVLEAQMYVGTTILGGKAGSQGTEVYLDGLIWKL